MLHWFYRTIYGKSVVFMKILVSACLLGVACKYSGGDNVCPALLNAVQHSGHTFIPICPEVYGGLPTPRPPAERTGDCVLTETGTDVTAELLQAHGIFVYNEDNFTELLRYV